MSNGRITRENWLSRETFLRLSQFSARTLRRAVQHGTVKFRPAKKRLRNGRTDLEFAASSLPPFAQLQLAKERLAASHSSTEAMTVIPHPDSHVDKQLGMFLRPPLIPEMQRIGLDTEQQIAAQKRLDLINPLIEFDNKSNGHKAFVRLLDGREFHSKNTLVEYVAKQRGVPTSQIWRWYSRYKKTGFPGLANRIRSDKHQSRFFQKFPDVALFSQAKYLGERVSIARTHEAIVAEWNKGAFKEISGDPPHYDTVRAYLQALPRPMSIMAHDGERQFHERCAPYILVDYAKMQPNEEWVCDHAQHDVWLLNDCLPGYEKYTPLRPYVTAIIDMRTRLVLSAVWSVNPSSHTISSALRKAILQWGLPQTFYVDNGKDFLSVAGTKLGRIDLSPECSGVLTQLGIAARHCLPKHPQSKNVERFFGTMHSRFDRLWGDFYCGTSPATRPELCDEALKQHHALVKGGKMQQSRIPRASEFISLCQDWMEHEYNNTPHSGRGMKNEATGDDYTPLDLFNEMLPIERRKLIQNHRDSPHALNALFWKVERRKVSEGGCVTLDGRRYEPADSESYGELFSKIERDILVACDPADMGEALALDLDRRVIGRMQCQALIARGPVSADDMRDGLRRQRRARRVVRDYLDSLTPQHGTELDRMRRNSRRMPIEQLPAPDVVAMSLKKAAGATEMYIDDIVNKFLEKGGD